MIFLTGDTHARAYERFKYWLDDLYNKGISLTKDDYIIVLGDFGHIFKNDDHPAEDFYLDEIDDMPFTTLFVDGNHENHERLAKLPTVEKFGSTVGRVRDSIFHLRRGRCYVINDKKFFTFGGAYSIDKSLRTPGFDWWPEEMPSKEEYEIAYKTIDNNDNLFDYILTHDIPKCIFERVAIYLNFTDSKRYSEQHDVFQNIYETVAFNHWYAGHYHINETFDDVTILYEQIIELK